MALFESYERRIDKINGVLAQYGISSVEECRDICKAKGFDPYEIVKGIQPICFENACWAYTVGAAIAVKSGVKTAAEAAKMIGVGLQSFCIDGSVAEDRKVGLGHGNLGAMLLSDESKCFAFLAGHESFAAAEGAIKVFGDNLRQLLLQPPIRGKTVMGLDPGYRMGCKVAVVDPTGKVLDTNVVYPVPEFKRVDQAKKTIKSMVLKNEVEVMAIGNGTAGHETEEFAAAVIRELAEEKGLHLQYMVVSEAGASVYSASKLAAEEFPQYDVNLRSAVSIARRLQDPLAELVKIDPKAVGVGQYQHDMPQKRLNETLDGVVEDCVNSVGVDLNTASAPLLARVAGITNATAKNIVAWREEEGAFTSRAQLKKVKGLGPKAFEQCAGFLRLPGAKNPLDATAVHPESYPAAKGLLEACGCDAKEIGTDAMQSLPVRVKNCGTKALCEALGVGEPTLMDIVSELCKPGRDVRDSLPKPLLRSDVMGLEDLKPGMELKGTVRNVIDFGAFVDIGVHQDGLVHVSQISDKFIKNPRDALKVGDVVQVKVLSVDTAKKRIALTMKGVPQS